MKNAAALMSLSPGGENASGRTALENAIPLRGIIIFVQLPHSEGVG
jgi:hypothetical protein